MPPGAFFRFLYKAALLVLLSGFAAVHWAPVRVGAAAEGAVAAQADSATIAQTDCQQVLAEFDANPQWLAELRDPRLQSQAEIADRVARYRRLSECLSEAETPVTGRYALARDLADLFVALAGGLLDAPSEGGYLLRFADIQDPAVVALRDEVGIPLPDGYVFLWLLPSREDAPVVLQEVLANSSVRGVTMQTRYIAVLDEVDPGTPLEDIQRRQVSATLSHEFVHAYIKSAMGPDQGFALPEWFDEGLAIYFSGSSKPTSVVFFDENGHQRYWSVPPEDYARYRDIFQYLEDVYGRPGLIERIRLAVLQNDPGLLYRELGVLDEEGLYEQVEAARIRRSLTRLGLFVGLPALALLIFAAARTLAPFLMVSPLLLGFKRSYDEADVAWLYSHGSLSGLVRLLGHRSSSDPAGSANTRAAAAQALGEMDDMRAIDPLLDSLPDDNPLVRGAAARSLGNLVCPYRPYDHVPSDPPTRARVMAALFGLLQRDPIREVRWAAAEALYLAGGLVVRRPLLAEIRGWLSQGRDRWANQRWFFRWAVGNGLDGLLVDLYPWLDAETRRSVVWHLSSHMPVSILNRLADARDSGDPALRELAAAVLDSPDPGPDGDRQALPDLDR